MSDELNDAFLANLTAFLGEYEAPVELLEEEAETSDLLVDSHRLLAETEALLASCATKDSPIQKPSEVTTTKKQHAIDGRLELRSKQAAKRRLKYRQKLKTERETLELAEQELSAEFDRLQQTRKKVKCLVPEDAAVPVWRAIATRQMEGRLVAEAQQRRLRSAVENRSKLIQEVGEMMKQNILVRATDTLKLPESRVDLVPDDTALYEAYLQDMDEVYAQTDDVFSAYGVANVPLVSYKMEPQRKSDGKVEYYNNLDVLLIPFEFEKTCGPMWQAMKCVHQQKDRRQYNGLTDHENTLAVKFRIAVPRESGKPIDMLVYLVMRRYIETNRMVIVWRALSEGEEEFSGMHSDETGWCIIRPISAKGDEVPVMPTVMQTFVRFVPMSIADKVEAQKASQFTHLVVLSAEEDGLEVARMMELLLLDDSKKY